MPPPILPAQDEGTASLVALRAGRVGASSRGRDPAGVPASVRTLALGRPARTLGRPVTHDHERDPSVHGDGPGGTDRLFALVVWRIVVRGRSALSGDRARARARAD